MSLPHEVIVYEQSSDAFDSPRALKSVGRFQFEIPLGPEGWRRLRIGDLELDCLVSGEERISPGLATRQAELPTSWREYVTGVWSKDERAGQIVVHGGRPTRTEDGATMTVFGRELLLSLRSETGPSIVAAIVDGDNRIVPMTALDGAVEGVWITGSDVLPGPITVRFDSVDGIALSSFGPRATSYPAIISVPGDGIPLWGLASTDVVVRLRGAQGWREVRLRLDETGLKEK
jgi:hypothetical protein